MLIHSIIAKLIPPYMILPSSYFYDYAQLVIAVLLGQICEVILLILLWRLFRNERRSVASVQQQASIVYDALMDSFEPTSKFDPPPRYIP